jgi:hypothetical protein
MRFTLLLSALISSLSGAASSGASSPEGTALEHSAPVRAATIASTSATDCYDKRRLHQLINDEIRGFVTGRRITYPNNTEYRGSRYEEFASDGATYFVQYDINQSGGRYRIADDSLCVDEAGRPPTCRQIYWSRECGAMITTIVGPSGLVGPLISARAESVE